MKTTELLSLAQKGHLEKMRANGQTIRHDLRNSYRCPDAYLRRFGKEPTALEPDWRRKETLGLGSRNPNRRKSLLERLSAVLTPATGSQTPRIDARRSKWAIGAIVGTLVLGPFLVRLIVLAVENFWK